MEILNKKIHPQSSPSTNLGFLGLIIAGCTSSNISLGTMNGRNELTEVLRLKPSSTRSNKKEIFSLNEIIANKKTLDNLKHLKLGWNGYQSLPIDITVLKKADFLVNQLERQPKIFPTGRGTLQFEFSNKEDYLEIEISSTENSFFEQKTENEFEGHISTEMINEKVNEFFA